MQRSERLARLYPQLVTGMGRLRSLVHEGIDLTSNQYRTLLAIAAAPDCSLGELARSLEVALPSASQMVERLVAQQLVERHPSPHSRRQVVIRLSDAGCLLIDELQQTTLRGYQKVLSRLTAAEQEDLLGAFETIARILNQLQPDEGSPS